MAMGGADTFIQHKGSILLRRGGFVLQIRRGVLEPEVLDDLEAMIANLDADERIAFVAVIEDEAEVPPTEYRNRQRAMLQNARERCELKTVVLVPAGGIHGTLHRSIARLVVIGQNVKIVGSVDEAIQIVAPHIRQPPSVLLETLHYAREQAAGAMSKAPGELHR